MSWIILREFVDRRTWVEVRCSCGHIGTRRKDHVLSGKSKECKRCASKRTAKKFGMPRTFKGVGGLGKTFFNRIKYGAKKRDIPFDLTVEFLWNLYLKQEMRCALTGLAIEIVPETKNTAPDYERFTASLDRIDSSLGYTEQNVWWVHKEINRFKNNYSLDQFLTMCRLVATHHANPDPSASNESLLAVDAKEQRLDGEDFQPINRPRASDTLDDFEGDDIV